MRKERQIVKLRNSRILETRNTNWKMCVAAALTVVATANAWVTSITDTTGYVEYFK